MSSLYYQHQQHEQQQREQQQQQQQQQQQHYQYHLQQQHEQHHQEQNYHSQQQQSQSHSHTHNYQSEHPTPPNDALSNHLNGEQDCGPSVSLKQNLPGQQSRDQVLDTLLAMMSQERSGYHLDSYFPRDVLPPQNENLPRQQNIIHGGWREKICQWSYNVVDHFDLPREIVSISLNYFDRYMATLSTGPSSSTSTSITDLTDNKLGKNHQGNSGSKNTKNSSPSSSQSNQGSGDLALLASLGTLHLATKVHATNHNDYDPAMGPLEEQHHKVPSLSTLANLSRGQFGPAEILEMEKLLLNALQWRLHPPTLYALVTLLLKLLPTTLEDERFGIKPSIASELFEVAMYVAELSVCDAFFVERQIPSSVIALAAICTSMDELLVPEDSSMMAGLSLNSPNRLGSSFWAGSGCFTEDHRSLFLNICEEQLGLGKRNIKFEESLDRLRSMYLGASASNLGNPKPQEQQVPSSNQQSRSRTNSYNPPTSPSSIADMSLSTINSTIHSMADTTINNGDPIKRGDSMVSSINCHSKTETLTLADTLTDCGHDNDNSVDHDELFEEGVVIGLTLSRSHSDTDQHSHSNSHASNNFRYSPSPPREGEAGYNDESYESHQHQQDEQERSFRRSLNSSTIMSCSPIITLR